jgi:hypothetical protein
MQMTDKDGPDYTMLSRRWSGETLVTIETALELARSVHRSVYGADDLSANEPLTAKEDEDNWVVQGSKKLQELKAGEPLDGPMVMKISKYDAQILSYMFGIKPDDKSKL